VYTFVRGVCVMRDGAVIGRPGHGQLVRPGN
jgi:N-acyl-D-aspartate/D-glutamate deacylase